MILKTKSRLFTKFIKKHYHLHFLRRWLYVNNFKNEMLRFILCKKTFYHFCKYVINNLSTILYIRKRLYKVRQLLSFCLIVWTFDLMTVHFYFLGVRCFCIYLPLCTFRIREFYNNNKKQL